MNFKNVMDSGNKVLMEGALGERLKREYGLTFDENVAMAGLVKAPKGRAALQALWNSYIEIAKEHDLPFLATTPTRRANRERIAQSEFDENLIRDNVEFLKRVRREANIANMFIGGLMGCKGDAYTADLILTADEARDFHSWQCDLFKKAEVDFLFAGIMPALSEAIGMAQAMEATGLPYIISFMIEKNGRLIDGTTIYEAICNIDAQVSRQPLCYMTNCVHPDVLYEGLNQPFNQTDTLRRRFKGIQANTSPLSPAELDGASDLKSSDPDLLASSIVKLSKVMDLSIVGGCCGTDHHHMEAITKKYLSISGTGREAK